MLLPESLLPLLLLLVASRAGAYDKGFELLFTSNRDEVVDLPVTFDKPLPASLNGTLYHNGLGTFDMGQRTVSHFFDAFAKMHSWKLQGDTKEGFFTTKFASSGYYNDSMHRNDIAPYMLFANPKPGFGATADLEKFRNGQDNVNVNLLKMGPDLVAVGDFARLYTIDDEELTTKERVDAKIPGVDRIMPANMDMSTSHPVPEYGTKNWINIVTVNNPFSGGPQLHVVRCADAKQREVIASIDFKDVPYMHSFITTEKYVILFVNPVILDMKTLIVTGEPLQGLKWVDGKPTYVHVVEIATGKVQVLKTEAMFGLHFANAFVMSDNRISVDIITYPDIQVIKAQMLKDLLDPIRRNNIPGDKAHLKRYILDLNTLTVQNETFETSPSTYVANRFDFPVFNENFRFKKYCYIYGVAQKADGKMFSKWVLVKKNLCAPAKDKLWYRENHYPGEPWFVGREGAVDEDDGHLMSVMLDGEKRVSYLAIFDARSLELVNTAYLPVHLPMTLHGRFLN